MRFYKLRELKRNIKAFFYWGWKMRTIRWWDSFFILETIGIYLEYMETNFQKALDNKCMGNFVGQEEVIEEMKEARRLYKEFRSIDELDYAIKDGEIWAQDYDKALTKFFMYIIKNHRKWWH